MANLVFAPLIATLLVAFVSFTTASHKYYPSPLIITGTPWPQPTPESPVYKPPPVHKYPPHVHRHTPSRPVVIITSPTTPCPQPTPESPGITHVYSPPAPVYKSPPVYSPPTPSSEVYSPPSPFYKFPPLHHTLHAPFYPKQPPVYSTRARVYKSPPVYSPSTRVYHKPPPVYKSPPVKSPPYAYASPPPPPY